MPQEKYYFKIKSSKPCTNLKTISGAYIDKSYYKFAIRLIYLVRLFLAQPFNF